VLDGVKAGALGKHPASEDPLHLARQLDLVDLDEGRGVRRIGRRARVAHPRRHLKSAELDGLIYRDLQVRDASRHLVEGGEHGDRVLDRFGGREACRGPAGHRESHQQEGKSGADRAARLRLISLHHAAHLMNGLQAIAPVRSWSRA